METVRFSVDVEAPRAKVWEVLWDDATYRDWSSVFAEGSHAVSEWREGSKIEFFDGQGNGMASRIEKLRPNEVMSFRHLAEIKDGKEQPFESADWSNGRETYTLREHDGATTVTVELDAPEQWKSFFEDKFPSALQRVKTLAEDR